MGRHHASFSTCFGLETGCNTEFIFERTWRSLECLDEAREDTGHTCLKVVTRTNEANDGAMPETDAVDELVNFDRVDDRLIGGTLPLM